MNQEYGNLTDLGLIDQEGRHLAYVGPYDLMDKNYSEAIWFKKVMEQGIYISDMFTGFRKVPHFIIAITRQDFPRISDSHVLHQGSKSGSFGRRSTRRPFDPWWRT